MNISDALKLVLDNTDLASDQMYDVMNQIMSGNATPAQIAGFLVGLRCKGESVDEIAAAAKVMREKATAVVDPQGRPLVDTCGTGGDGASTFNISTTAAFVAAGAGVAVAKHGNRAVSSKSGSADVLKALGVNIEIDNAIMGTCLDQAGIAFLFAPALHGAMKHAIGPRRELGVRTIFNVLGPLTNPAGAKNQLIGVFDGALTETLAKVLASLGSESAMVVHGSDGLDEITLTGTTQISRLQNGEVTTTQFDPTAHGLSLCGAQDLVGAEAEANGEITRSVLAGEQGPRRDICLLNAAAVLQAAGVAGTWEIGLEQAAESIDSGRAAAALDKLIAVSNQ